MADRLKVNTAGDARAGAGHLDRSLTENELRQVLERAIAIHHEETDATFGMSDALELGSELGLEPHHVMRAMSELLDPPVAHRISTGVVSASTRIARPSQMVASDLASALRRRAMDPCPHFGRTCWTQRRDWWPDVQRIGGELHVQTEVAPRPDDASEVTLRVDVRLKATGYGAGAGGSAALLWLVVGPAGLVPAVASTLAAAGSAVAAYRRRAAGIGARLEDLLIELR